MQSLSFREAQPSDLPEVVAMLADDTLGRSREAPAPPLDPRYLAAFEAIQANADLQLIVMVEAGRTVGTLQLAFLPGLSKRGAWRGQIEAVRVVSDRRGQGLGARMIAWAVERCRARGCATVQLTTDRRRTDAHSFYERLGFKPTHLGYKLELGSAP